MRSKKKSLCCVSLVLVMAFVMICVTGDTARAQQDGVIVIANASVDESSLDRRTLDSLFLKKKTTWGGTRVEIVTLAGGEVHEQFLRTYLNKSERQYASYWNTLVFTGTGRPPRSFANEQDVVDYVANVKGAIGYVGPAADTTGVKRIAIEN